MKVIIRQDVPKLGNQGEIKNIAEGYARNYLIPRGLVLEATDKNLKTWEQEKVKLTKIRDQQVLATKDVAAKMEQVSFTVTVKVGDEGKLFGSVTNADIAKLLDEQGYKVDKHNVQLDEPIKEVGIYTVPVKLDHQVVANVKIWVMEEKKAAEEQA